MDGNLSGAATALNKLAKARQMALTKGGEEMDAFKAAGISVDDLRKKAPMELLLKMADAFKASDNAGAKLLITQKLLGKSSDGLVEVFNKGSGDLLEKQKAMENAGAFFSKDQLSKAEEASDGFKVLGLTMQGLKNSLGLALAASLTKVVESLSKFLVINREVIAQKFDVFLAHLPAIIEGVGAAFKVLWAVGSAVFNVFQGLSHLFGAEVVGGLVAVAILLPVILSVVGVVGGLVSVVGSSIGGLMRLWSVMGQLWPVIQMLAYWGRILMVALGRGLVSGMLRLASAIGGPVLAALRGLMVFMMANPFTIWIVAIVALAAIIYANWDAIVAYVTSAWERIKAVFDAQGFFGAMWQGILELWQGGLNAIVGMLKEIPGMETLIGKDFNFEFADRNAAAVTAGTVAKAQQQSFNGKLQIDVNSEGKARVTSMQSDNKSMQMDARNGMAGAPA